MGIKSSYGGWVVIALITALAIAIVGTILTLCRRRFDWQWGRRNIWSICEEWRQRLSWLWAPREEKVGLVKAQHPTAQTIPGVYRQTGNASQNLLHSDSDLRLDAQGAFTRFEAVDRDLHPPLGSANAIPPQPLRPAPQPRPMGRPRPSPLQAPSASEYLRMQDGDPGPLTPPPVPRPPNAARGSGTTAFIFQAGEQSGKCYLGSPYKTHTQNNDQSALRFDNFTARSIPESIQMTCYAMPNDGQSHETIYRNTEDSRRNDEKRDVYSGTTYTKDRTAYRQFELAEDEPNSLRYAISNGQLIERGSTIDPQEFTNTGAFTGQQQHSDISQHQMRQHGRKESRFNLENCGNSTAETIMESIYGPNAVTKILQNSHNWVNDLATRKNDPQSIEMTSYFRNSQSPQHDQLLPDDYGHMDSAISTKAQGLQRVSQYIESLPDLSNVYDSTSDLEAIQNEQDGIFERHENHENDDEHDNIDININQSRQVQLAPSPVPPPPAPPDPPNCVELVRENSQQTTGERIFNALRSVTSQSYIDASEFYNSVIESAQQQVPRFTFATNTTRSSLPNQSNKSDQREDLQATFYSEPDPETIGIDGLRRASDLYSPELNLEAHRTAQQVYNSLQDPPASPLLLRDLSQEPYPYMADPSFTRTSEDIFNSIEQRRKSMERLNGIHDSFAELEAPDSTRRRSSQDLYAALEEVQLKRRLSQSVEDSYGGYEMGEATSPVNRRGSLGPEPEPPPDESNLKRAVSCESVCSDTSVNLGDLEDVTVVGHVCVGLEHERWGGRGADCEGDLAVSVLEARDLVAPDGRPAQDTLARVCLLPDRQTHVQTRLYRGSPSPSYQEKFLFPLDGGPIGRTLLVEIISVEVSIGGGASLLGEASLKLGPAARPPATTWLPLISPALPIPHLGELMFSLSYLPTAERLTLVVVKARNLHGANDPVPGDFFVKVYLLQQGKKMHKKKTSSKRGEKSPIFNEAIIFSVPPHALQNIQLRLTVAENSTDPVANSKAFSVGHVIVGSTATGKSLAHWRQMLAALRRPVVMWHPLRK